MFDKIANGIIYGSRLGVFWSINQGNTVHRWNIWVVIFLFEKYFLEDLNKQKNTSLAISIILKTMHKKCNVVPYVNGKISAVKIFSCSILH